MTQSSFPLATIISLLIAGAAAGAGRSPVNRVVDEAAISHLSSFEKELVHEYAQLWPKVYDFYSSLEFEGSIIDESRTDKDASFVVDSEMQGTAKILDNQMFKIAGKMPDGSAGMVISTPSDVYGFLWNQEKEKYFLASRFTTSSVFMDQYISKYAFHIEPFSNGEFQRIVFGMARSPNQTWRLMGLEVLDEDGEEIAKATVVCEGENKGVHWRRLLLYRFYRNRSWAKRDVVSAFPDPEKRIYSVAWSRCLYEGEKDGVPLLKECIRESGTAPFPTSPDDPGVFDPESTTCLSRSRAIARQLIPGPPDRAEFDPEPFLKSMGGLGEIKPSTWRPTILVLNGLVLLFLGLFLLVRNRQKANARSRPSVENGL